LRPLGVLLGVAPVVSPDQDGDGDVDATDQLLLHARITAHDPRADLNCTGTEDILDMQAFAQFANRVCWDTAPARMHSWGRLKTHYR